MPLFFLHTINSEFRARDNGDEYDRPEDALTHGIRGAAAVVMDELHGGKHSAAVEVRVEQADGSPVLRSVVTMSVSPLLPVDPADTPPEPMLA